MTSKQEAQDYTHCLPKDDNATTDELPSTSLFEGRVFEELLLHTKNN